MKKKRLMQLVPLNTGFQFLMAGKLNYVIEGEGSEKYTFLPWGERGKREAFRQLSKQDL